MCLCGSKKIIKINPFKRTKKHNQQTAKKLCAYVVQKNLNPHITKTYIPIGSNFELSILKTFP